MSDTPGAGMDLLEEAALRRDPSVRRAAEELLWARRGDAADHAYRITGGRWKAARHQKLVMNRIAALVRRGGTSESPAILIIELPIREGKSEACSHRVPVWFLDCFPERWVMLATYEADFAASWGRKCRNTVLEYSDLLSVRIAYDSMAAHEWRTSAGGGMTTAGVGGPFTGKGGHLLILDDPFKNAEEALSQNHRDKVWDWWQSTFRTRFEPGAVCVIPMARWHQDDLSGRLQRNAGGDHVEVIRLPGIAEENDPLGRAVGEALWPERVSREALEVLRESMGSYWFGALVQQRPVPREGGMFKRGDFRYIGAAPASGRAVRYWDKAATAPRKGSDPDWTAGARMRVFDGKYFIEDVRRMRGSPESVEKLIHGTAHADGQVVRIRMEQEPGSSGVESVAHYRRLLAGFSFSADKVTGPKEVRAEALASQVEGGNVFLVRTGDRARDAWIEPFLDEVEQFPRGAKDDQVDAAVGAFQSLALKAPAEIF